MWSTFTLAFRHHVGRTDWSQLVSAVRAAWPHPDPESDAVLRTLEASLAIEAAERAGGAWPYMQERAKWTRSNLAALLRDDHGSKVPPKVMMKFGYSHMIRGANYFNVFDLGAMADEVAAFTGRPRVSFSRPPGSRLSAGRAWGKRLRPRLQRYGHAWPRRLEPRPHPDDPWLRRGRDLEGSTCVGEFEVSPRQEAGRSPSGAVRP